jgi:hypothetical protein
MPRSLVWAALLLSCGGISTKSSDGSDTGGASGGTTAHGTESGGTAVAGSTTSSAGQASGATHSSIGGGSTAGGFVNGGSQGGSTSASAGSSGDEPGTCAGQAPPTSNACRGVKTAASCQVQGQVCPCLRCGLADMGRRTCVCDTTWNCSYCEFPRGWPLPSDLPMCTTQADKLPCSELGQVCQGAPGGEACACYADDDGSLIWDCDKPPPGGGF